MGGLLLLLGEDLRFWFVDDVVVVVIGDVAEVLVSFSYQLTPPLPFPPPPSRSLMMLTSLFQMWEERRRGQEC